MPIPDMPWDIMSIDFISKLPDAHSYNVIMNVVDFATKQVHFVATHTVILAEGAAQLFLNNVWKLHRLPRAVISDHGPQFIADFMRKLYRILGIKVAALTAYHPQTDGQTERVNQELEQYICLFMNQHQDDWDELLSMAKF